MFSEQKRKDPDMAKKKNGGKELPFDSLDEKLYEGIAKLSMKEGKTEKKYSPGEKDEKKKLLKDKQSSSSLQLKGNTKKETQRSNSLERREGGVGYGLFEAVNLVSNIVDITKDSTMRRKPSDAERPAPVSAKHSKAGSKSSISSQSGPFASLKENAEKKKKSVDEDDAY